MDTHPTPPSPLSDDDIAELGQCLDAIEEPLEPIDISALDGYLCAVLLQPRPVPATEWLRWVCDSEEGRPAPGPTARRIAELAQRRHAELDRAIASRQWFDPWVFEFDDESGDEGTADLPPAALVQPWVAGFSMATQRFPDLLALADPALLEPLAVLYAVFDPEDLEDADGLRELIDTLEPPADLAEAVEDLVRSVLLIADVSRPRAPAARTGGGRRGARGAPARPGRPRSPSR
ncbi:MAG: YecA family protein [Rubrivivax sp.]